MALTSIFVYYGGTWINESYQGGEKKLIVIEVDDVSYKNFVDHIHKAFHVSELSLYQYSVYCMVQSPLEDGSSAKLEITNDLELRFALEDKVRAFYVSSYPLPSSGYQTAQQNFTSLLNAQIQQRRENVTTPQTNLGELPLASGFVDSQVSFSNEGSGDADGFSDDYNRKYGSAHYVEDENDDYDVADIDSQYDSISNDSLDNYQFESPIKSHDQPLIVDNSPPRTYIGDVIVPEHNVNTSQWTIPGAIYQASIPIDTNRMTEPYGQDYLHVGATFHSKEKLINTVGLYHLKNKVELWVERSNNKYYYVRCRYPEFCDFRMRATSSGTTYFWRITHLKAPHTCQCDLRKQPPKNISYKVIGAYFAPRLHVSGAVLKAREMVHYINDQYGFKIKYRTALAGRDYAIKLTYGDPYESFQLLPSYLHMVQHCNPGSQVALKTSSVDVFEYAYMALGASINGFINHCRPIIIVDGTHLKGSYKGILFVAVSVDGNNQVFPLAVGIGDTENDKSWKWFISQIRRGFGCPGDLLFVSDQHGSIIKAVKSIYPEAVHGLCYFHLRKNLAKFGEHICDIFASAAYCYRKDVCDRYMNDIQKVSVAAYDRLMALKPEVWSRSYCPVRRYGILTSNHAESLNSTLRWARRLPVCTMLEFVRTMIGKWFLDRRSDAIARSKVHSLTIAATEVLRASVNEGLTMTIEPVNDSKFCVKSGGRRFIVDLANTSCSCKEFDLNLIPCAHAAAAIMHAKQSTFAHVSNYYTTETLVALYSSDVYPTPEIDEWNIPEEVNSRIVLTPSNPKQPGRPRTKRMKARFESSKRVCSRCKQEGHYRSTCQAVLTHASLSTAESLTSGSVTRR